MLLAAQSVREKIVIGGACSDCAAVSLDARGMDVTVLHVMPTLMERQLDPAAGYLPQKAVEERGIKVITKHNTAIVGNGKVEGIELDDNSIIPQALSSWLSASARMSAWRKRLASRSIAASLSMTACAPRCSDILSLGECAEVGGMVQVLVAPLYEWPASPLPTLQATPPAFVHRHADQAQGHRYRSSIRSATLADGDDREEIVLRDATAGAPQAPGAEGNRIIGTVLYGRDAPPTAPGSTTRRRSQT